MTNDLLKPISSGAIGAVLSCVLSGMTGCSAGSISSGRTMSMSVSCRSGISRSISESTKGKVKAEQVELNSRVLHCLAKARSIMRQKTKPAQPQNTVHKDMVREQVARDVSPEVGRKLRQIMDQLIQAAPRSHGKDNQNG